MSSVFTVTGGEMMKSGVWKWEDLEVETTASGERRAIFEGEGADVSRVLVHATTLNPGETPHPPHTHHDMEELLIVKEGSLRVTIAGETKVIGPGSVAIALVGDEHSWSNAGDIPATYYVLRYQSRWQQNAAEGRKPRLTSRIMDENDIAFAANPRGGWRGFFNGSTSTLRLFELHETTLMGGVQNHPVHTHGAEEMVIMLDGHVELEMNGIRYEGKPGDVYFVAANDPHTLFTHGDKLARYFAFQWQ